MIKPYIAVIGPGKETCTDKIYQFGKELGKILSDEDYIIVSGGKEGIMQAVCEGAHNSKAYKTNSTIGILPEDEKEAANYFCDIIIPTGIGTARNKIIINTADIIVAVSGGAGTLSEIAFAWQMRKPVICYTGFDGWSKNLAGKRLDSKHPAPVYKADSLLQIIEIIKNILNKN